MPAARRGTPAATPKTAAKAAKPAAKAAVKATKPTVKPTKTVAKPAAKAAVKAAPKTSAKARPAKAAAGSSQIDRRRSRARSQPSEAYLQRRRQLTEAAASVMRRKGYRDMTLGDVAAEIGADRASVYYYVAGKDELLAEMVLGAVRSEAQIVGAIVASELGPAEKVRRILEAMMVAFDEHFPYLYIWVYEDPSRLEGIDESTLEQIVDLSQRNYEHLRDVLADGIEAGEFVSTLPVGILAQSITGLLAWTYRWYEPGHALSPQTMAAGLSDLVLAGLVAPGSAKPKSKPKARSTKR